MARYEGYKTGPLEWHVEKNGSRFRAEQSQKVFNHSPDGFAWGYGGSGPSQLSLALLMDTGISEERAVSLHHQFKRDVVATWDKDSGWKITTEEITTWIANNENGSRTG